MVCGACPKAFTLTEEIIEKITVMSANGGLYKTSVLRRREPCADGFIHIWAWLPSSYVPLRLVWSANAPPLQTQRFRLFILLFHQILMYSLRCRFSCTHGKNYCRCSGYCIAAGKYAFLTGLAIFFFGYDTFLLVCLKSLGS